MNRYLVDTSVWSRAQNEAVNSVLAPLVTAGAVSTCPIVTLECAISARNKRDYDEIMDELQGLDQIQITPDVTGRASQIQALLVSKSQHRGASPSDLLIAACAEAGGDVVLHYDRDFETIGKFAGTAHRWVVPAGSIP